MKRRTFLFAGGGVLLVSLLVGLVGSFRLPPDAHEIFVLQSAQEMHDRGDWVLPVYDGRPRLAKPPLSYWLTGAAAWAAGDLNHIQPWEGRLPSILAGAGVVGMTLGIGAVLVSRRVALLAGLFAATNRGYLAYTHSARPDMLYAACCTLAVLGFVLAWRRSTTPPHVKPAPPDSPPHAHPAGLPGVRPRVWPAAGLMWLGVALATLAKGPHLPLLMLGGGLLFLLARAIGGRDAASERVRSTAASRGTLTTRLKRSVPHILRILRPELGVLILLALAAPWWIALRLRLGARLASSELGGGGYALDWWKFLHFGYLPKLALVMLPWTVLAPLAIALLWRKSRTARRNRLFMWMMVVVLPVLSVAAHQRDYYLLPLLGPMCLLLAAGVDRMSRLDRRIRHQTPWWLATATPVIGALIFAAAVILVLPDHARLGEAELPEITAIVLLAGLLAVHLARRKLFRGDALRRLTPVTLAFAIFFGCLAASPHLWSVRRYRVALFARRVVAMVPPTVPLATYGIGVDEFLYYGQRHILRIRNLSDLSAPGSPAVCAGRMALVLRQRDLDLLHQTSHPRVRLRARNVDDQKDWMLVELRSSRSASNRRTAWAQGGVGQARP